MIDICKYVEHNKSSKDSDINDRQLVKEIQSDLSKRSSFEETAEVKELQISLIINKDGHKDEFYICQEWKMEFAPSTYYIKLKWGHSFHFQCMSSLI